MYLKKWFWGIIFVLCLFVLSAKNIAPFFLAFGAFKAFVCFHAYISAPIRRETSKDLIFIFAIIIFVMGVTEKYLPIFIRENVVQSYKIPSGGMRETLQIGDHILVKKFAYYLKE